MTGRGIRIDAAPVRAEAIPASTYRPADRMVLFELGIDTAESRRSIKGELTVECWRAQR